MPMDSTWAEFWKVVFMPDPAPRCWGGRLFMTPARLGEPKTAMDRPVRNRSSAEEPVGEVDRQQLEQDEAERGAEHPAGGEGTGAEAVGQDPESGPAMRKPRVSGSMAMPAHRGSRAKS